MDILNTRLVKLSDGTEVYMTVKELRETNGPPAGSFVINDKRRGIYPPAEKSEVSTPKIYPRKYWDFHWTEEWWNE